MFLAKEKTYRTCFLASIYPRLTLRSESGLEWLVEVVVIDIRTNIVRFIRDVHYTHIKLLAMVSRKWVVRSRTPPDLFVFDGAIISRSRPGQKGRGNASGDSARM